MIRFMLVVAMSLLTPLSARCEQTETPARPTAPRGQEVDGIVNLSRTVPATTIGDNVKTALRAELKHAIAPHWRPPLGSQNLRTTVLVTLNPDGTIKDPPRVIRQEGLTESNRAQAELHKECAIKAVLLAAPYSTLPPLLYEGWKVIIVTFDRKMSQ